MDAATENKTVAGESTTIKSSSEARILEFLWYMKKQGYKETTIISRGVRLRRLIALGADLNNPESVKETIAKQDKWKDSMKEVAVFAYDLYAKWVGLKWQRPRYKAIRQLPFIPQEREIDDVIAGVNKEIALFLQIGKDTGARAGEIYRLEWTDIDFEGRTISIIAEKNSNPRVFRMQNKLLDMLHNIEKTELRIFVTYKNLNNLRRTYEKQRKRLAKKLANPRLNKITFHTLRHWKGSTEYHKTKDILHVMQTLGHKNIKNTLLYTQLLNIEEDNQYVCKIAQTPKEICDLVTLGFEFVTEKNGLQFFRKRI
ncbi:MAG: tyrosine-type recombinase/integrase [Candidatus Bathyarchaeota archaeon]|nr:tyrosine-type recombinase/integrase [Candidatus Bathyarchaeota archaeon]